MPMRWISGPLMVSALTACTSSPSGPDEAATCGQLTDLAVETVKDPRDAAVNSSGQDFERLQGDAQSIVRGLRDSSEVMSARFDELGCDSAEWEADTRPRVLDLARRSTGAGMAVLDIGLLFFAF